MSRIYIPHPITGKPILPELERKKGRLEVHVGDNRVLLHIWWNGREEWFPFTVNEAEQVAGALSRGAKKLAMDAIIKSGGGEIVGPL